MTTPTDSPRPIVAAAKRTWRRHGRAAIAASVAGAAGVAAGKAIREKEKGRGWRDAKRRAKNALITGTAGGFAGSLVDSGKSGHRGARIGALVGGLAGALNSPKKKSRTAESVTTGGDWNFDEEIRAIAFGLLGAGKPGDYRRPHIVNGAHDVPPGMGAYAHPSVLNQKFVDAMPEKPRTRLRAGGLVMTGPRVSPMMATASGYESPAALQKALRRHELTHSIQMRGGLPVRIRDLVKNEIGAYGAMHRRIKGGNRWLRRANNAVGVGLSTAVGALTSPVLRQRAALRGKQAAIGAAGVASGGLIVKQANERRFSEHAFEGRDNWQRARDAALTAGGIATVGAAGIATVRSGRAIKGLARRGRALVRKANVPATASNMRNATAVYSDVGRLYNQAKTNVSAARGAFRKGMAEGQASTPPRWKSRLVSLPGVAPAMKKIGLDDGSRTTSLSDARPAERRWRDRLDMVKAGLGVGTGVAGIVAVRKIGNAGRNAINKLEPFVKQSWTKHVEPAVGEVRKTATAWRHTAKSVNRNVAKIASTTDRLPKILGGTGKGASSRKVTGGRQVQAETVPVRTKFLGLFQSAAADLVRFDRGDYLDEKGRHASAWDVLTGKKRAYNTVFNPKTRRHEVDLTSSKDASLLDAAGAVHSQAKNVARWSGRGTAFVRDAKDAVTGAPRRRDASGRSQKREWEKPWFQRHAKELLATGALVASGVAYRRSPTIRKHVDEAKAAGERWVNRGTKWAEDRMRGGAAPPMPALKVTPPAAPPQPMHAKSKAFVLPPPKGPRTVVTLPKQRKGVKHYVQPPPPNLKGGWTQGGLERRMNEVLLNLFRFDVNAEDAGWDVRDPRGRSARVFAPGSGRRDRREKRWHERIENERKLWGAGIGGALLTGAGSAAALLRKKPQIAGLRPPVKQIPRRRGVRKAAPEAASSSNVIPMTRRVI